MQFLYDCVNDFHVLFFQSYTQTRKVYRALHGRHGSTVSFHFSGIAQLPELESSPKSVLRVFQSKSDYRKFYFKGIRKKQELSSVIFHMRF